MDPNQKQSFTSAGCNAVDCSGSYTSAPCLCGKSSGRRSSCWPIKDSPTLPSSDTSTSPSTPSVSRAVSS